MSKRAEEKALDFYPLVLRENYGDGLIEEANYQDARIHSDCFRRVFILGYEQAEKDTIERAARWIMKSENQAKARFRITDDEFIELFRKAMEEK